MKKKHSFLYRNGLSLAFLFLMIITLGLQTYTGWKEHNQHLEEKGASAIKISKYLYSGHFLQSTFENWESEFLQMALFVLFTVWLKQEGSAESKDLDKKEEVDREPKPSPDAPWPVRKGGLLLKLYKSSLSLSLFILFLISLCIHLYGSWIDFNEEQRLAGKLEETLTAFLTRPKFWFESFQNWQSEFLSVFAIVILSVFLRQQGSSQSKPVDTPHYEIE